MRLLGDPRIEIWRIQAGNIYSSTNSYGYLSYARMHTYSTTSSTSTDDTDPPDPPILRPPRAFFFFTDQNPEGRHVCDADEDEDGSRPVRDSLRRLRRWPPGLGACLFARLGGRARSAGSVARERETG